MTQHDALYSHVMSYNNEIQFVNFNHAESFVSSNDGMRWFLLLSARNSITAAFGQVMSIKKYSYKT